MADLFRGSVILNSCKKAAQGVRNTARHSLLFRPKAPREHTTPGAVKLVNRWHPILATQQAMAKSPVFNWLYHYWENLLAGPASALLWLMIPFCAGMFGVLWYKGGWAPGHLILAFLGIAALLLLKMGTLEEVIRGWWLYRRVAKWVPLPKGTPRRSVCLYLALCGLAGVAAGWKLGLLIGGCAALVLAVAPAVFAIPPMALLYLLMGALPLAGTALCWILSVALCVTLMFARAFGKEQGRPVDGWDLALTVFPLYCIASTLFSYNVGDSAKVTFMWLGLFVCAFALRRLITTPQRLVGALTALTLGGVVSGCIGLLQYLTGQIDTTWTDTSMFEDLELRVYSTFANPNVFGEFLLFLIPLVLGLILYTENPKLRLLLIGADGLLLVNLALTYSRGCYVGIALTALFFLWHYSKKWMAVILTLGLPLAIVVMPQSVVERILSIGNMSDGSTSYRMMIYVGTLAMLTHHWLGGIGLGEGAFNTVYPLYAVPGALAEHSHSLFFQLAVSFGVMGLVYGIGLLVAYQKTTGAARKKAKGPMRGLTVAFNTVLWGLMTQSIFDYTWYNYRLFQLFWIVVALGLSVACMKEDNHDQA